MYLLTTYLERSLVCPTKVCKSRKRGKVKEQSGEDLFLLRYIELKNSFLVFTEICDSCGCREDGKDFASATQMNINTAD